MRKDTYFCGMKKPLLQFIDNTQSTNELLADLVVHGLPSGEDVPEFYAIHADFQVHGHGMGDNKWFSEPKKNILASIYFQPRVSASQQFAFNQYFALTSLSFVRKYLPDACIKWPNDLYVHGRKLAGDLTQHTIRGNHIQHTIAGIGININQDWFPSEIPHPTSLFLESGKNYDVPALFKEYHAQLIQEYDCLNSAQSSFPELHDTYVQHLYQLNECREYLIHGVQTEASIRDVDEYGRLILEDRKGQTHTCGFKEVVFL